MSKTNKLRINELARELEVKAQAILEALPKVGVGGKKTHSSSLEAETAEQIRELFRRQDEDVNDQGKVSEKAKNPELLEAEVVILANDEFHKVAGRVKQEVGSMDSKKIFFEWNEWLKRSAKKHKQNV